MQTYAVERSIWIAAPRERVWQAITDPAQVGLWFSPGIVWKSEGSGVGGKLYIEGPDNTRLHENTIHVYDPPNQVAMRSEAESAETSQTVTWTLIEENGGTRLTVTERGFGGLPEEARRQRMDQDTMGFGMVLENIAALVEGKPLPYPGGF